MSLAAKNHPLWAWDEDWEQGYFKIWAILKSLGSTLSNGAICLTSKTLNQSRMRPAKSLSIFPEEIILTSRFRFGGGLGIPYTEDQKAINFSDVSKILLNLKEKYQLKKIWMELGRFAVGECGYYFAKIIDRKKVRGQEILVLNGGINHIARPALVNQFFPCQSFKNSEMENTKFQIHGPLCTALDYLGTFDLPSDLKQGDWVTFSQVGAYGFTEAMPFSSVTTSPLKVSIIKGTVSPRPPKTSTDWMV